MKSPAGEGVMLPHHGNVAAAVNESTANDVRL